MHLLKYFLLAHQPRMDAQGSQDFVNNEMTKEFPLKNFR
jgi:hypothetical protein